MGLVGSTNEHLPKTLPQQSRPVIRITPPNNRIEHFQTTRSTQVNAAMYEPPPNFIFNNIKKLSQQDRDALSEPDRTETWDFKFHKGTVRSCRSPADTMSRTPCTTTFRHTDQASHLIRAKTLTPLQPTVHTAVVMVISCLTLEQAVCLNQQQTGGLTNATPTATRIV